MELLYKSATSFLAWLTYFEALRYQVLCWGYPASNLFMYTQCETSIVSWKRDVTWFTVSKYFSQLLTFCPKKGHAHVCESKPSVSSEPCGVRSHCGYSQTSLGPEVGASASAQQSTCCPALLSSSLNTCLRHNRPKPALLVSRGNLFYKLSVYNKMYLLGILSF